MLNLSPLIGWSGQGSSADNEAASWLSQLCLMRPGGQHKDVCRSGGQGWVSQESTESCVAIWKDGALEGASTKAASELCKCLGINLCGRSLRIKAGGRKRLRFFLLALLSKQV